MFIEFEHSSTPCPMPYALCLFPLIPYLCLQTMSEQNLFIFLSMLLFASCTDDIFKDNVDIIYPGAKKCSVSPAPLFSPGIMEHGRATGLKNCLPFMGSATAYKTNIPGISGIGIEIRTFEDWGFFLADKEMLVVAALSSRPGIYSMYDSTRMVPLASYNTKQDHDVAEDTFEMDESYSNIMQFHKVDLESGMVEGIFNCRLLIRLPKSGHNPDTIIFTDCHFIADIIE